MDAATDVVGKVGKCVALATHSSLRKRLTAPLKALGVHFDATARNLGVDQAGDNASGVAPVQAARWKEARRQGARLPGLKKLGGKVIKAVKCALKPKVAYAGRCVGVPPKEVKWLRSVSSAALPGQHRGCSTSLRLAIYRADPGPDLVALPVFQWAAAVWERHVPADVFKKAWRRQMPRVSLAPSAPRARAAAAAVAVAPGGCRGSGQGTTGASPPTASM